MTTMNFQINTVVLNRYIKRLYIFYWTFLLPTLLASIVSVFYNFIFIFTMIACIFFFSSARNSLSRIYSSYLYENDSPFIFYRIIKSKNGINKISLEQLLPKTLKLTWYGKVKYNTIKEGKISELQ